MKPLNLRDHEVKQLLETGRVTVRREMQEQPPEWVQAIEYANRPGVWFGHGMTTSIIACTLTGPPWSPGDKLWVRECWSPPWVLSDWKPSDIAEDTPVHYWADGDPLLFDCTRPKPSQHMPRWASRITLIARDVRAERNEETGRWDWVGEMERVDA
jgi:hypothetical protein